MFYLPLSPFNFISLLNFFYSLLHNFIIFPPQCFYSLLHNFYYFPSSMFFIPLLHLHLLISIVFSPPPPLPHVYCFPSTTTTTTTTTTFYCFPSTTTTSASFLLFSLQVWSFRPFMAHFGLLLLLFIFIVSPPPIPPPPPPPPPPPHVYCFPLKRPKGQNQTITFEFGLIGLILAFWSFRGKTIEHAGSAGTTRWQLGARLYHT